MPALGGCSIFWLLFQISSIAHLLAAVPDFSPHWKITAGEYLPEEKPIILHIQPYPKHLYQT
jgi:hypothetical protein